MLKLYKKSAINTEYLEVWQNEQSVVIHTGKLGEDGEIESIEPEDNKSCDEIIAEQKDQALKNNYQEISLEDQHHLIIQYKQDKLTKQGKNIEDVQYKVEEIINETLGWTGNGHCDASDLGTNTINIFSFVIDPEIAKKSILETLKAENLLDAMTIAIEEDDSYKVLWPESHKGEFKIY